MVCTSWRASATGGREAGNVKKAYKSNTINTNAEQFAKRAIFIFLGPCHQDPLPRVAFTQSKHALPSEAVKQQTRRVSKISLRNWRCLTLTRPHEFTMTLINHGRSSSAGGRRHGSARKGKDGTFTVDICLRINGTWQRIWRRGSALSERPWYPRKRSMTRSRKGASTVTAASGAHGSLQASVCACPPPSARVPTLVNAQSTWMGLCTRLKVLHQHDITRTDGPRRLTPDVRKGLARRCCKLMKLRTCLESSGFGFAFLIPSTYCKDTT